MFSWPYKILRKDLRNVNNGLKSTKLIQYLPKSLQTWVYKSCVIVIHLPMSIDDKNNTIQPYNLTTKECRTINRFLTKSQLLFHFGVSFCFLHPAYSQGSILFNEYSLFTEPFLLIGTTCTVSV